MKSCNLDAGASRGPKLHFARLGEDPTEPAIDDTHLNDIYTYITSRATGSRACTRAQGHNNRCCVLRLSVLVGPVVAMAFFRPLGLRNVALLRSSRTCSVASRMSSWRIAQSCCTRSPCATPACAGHEVMRNLCTTAGTTSAQRKAPREAETPPTFRHKTAGWAYECKYLAQGHASVAGVAFAGERSMAGPVVAAAVCVDSEFFGGTAPVPGVADPTKLSVEELRWVYEQLVRHPRIQWSVASVSHKSIDHLRILPVSRALLCPPPSWALCVSRDTMPLRVDLAQALSQACSDAVDKLEPVPTWTITDAPSVPIRLRNRCLAIKHGRASSYSVAAAAIIAAAHHRRVMFQLHRRWPAYGFIRHMGRPTAQHKAAIKELGPSPAHRLRAGLGSYAKIGH